jgi:hypothetical protein
MGITQATRNPLEYILALRQGKVKNPSLMKSLIGDGHGHKIFLTNQQVTNRLGDGNHQE